MNTQNNQTPAGVYGGTIPRVGRNLIAEIIGTGEPLEISRIMVGSGVCPEGMFPGDLTDLVEPVAAATSTMPVVDGDTVHLTVEYRSDLNGGLEYGFWINEFAVFAKAGDGAEAMIYYGTLGDYPQWVSAYSDGIDTRRFDVEITVGEGATVIVDYAPEAFMTSEDVMDLCTTTILPMLLEEAQELIDTHNADQEAHPALQSATTALDSRLTLLELMYNTDVSGNPFSATFESLTGLTVTGVWNKAQNRIEF